MVFGIKSGGVMDWHANKNIESPVKIYLIFILFYATMYKRGSSRSNASDQSNTPFKLVGIVDILNMKFLCFIIITVFMVISSH